MCTCNVLTFSKRNKYSKHNRSNTSCRRIIIITIYTNGGTLYDIPIECRCMDSVSRGGKRVILLTPALYTKAKCFDFYPVIMPFAVSS